MPADDIHRLLTDVLGAAARVAMDALQRFREGRAQEYAELRAAFDAGEVQIGVDVILHPEPGVQVWAQGAIGARQVLITVPARETSAGMTIN